MSKAGSWPTTAVDGGMKIFLGNWQGPMASLAFDPQGNPAIAYYYAFRGLKYAHYQGKSWHKVWVGKPKLTYTYPHHLTLSFATKGPHKGQPRIFFRKLKQFIYATSVDGKSWQTKPLLTLKGKKDKYLSPSLALDPYGNPAIAYIDRDTKTVWVRFKHGGQDRHYEVSPPGEFPQQLSLAFDRQGNPALVYLDRKKNVLRFTRFTGSQWQQVKNVDIEYRSLVKGKNITNISLAFSHPGNNPAMAFNDGRRVKFATIFNNKWRVQTIARKGRCIALAFAPQGGPAVAYYISTGGDPSKAQNLRYAYMSEFQWKTESVTLGPEFALPTFSLNKQGNPFIGFYDPHKDELRVTLSPDYVPPPPPPPQPMKLVEMKPIITGVVKDALINTVIKDATLYFEIKSGWGITTLAKSDSNGRFKGYDEPPEQCMGIRIEHPNYHTRKIPINFEDGKQQKPWTVNVLLHPKDHWHTTITVDEYEYSVTSRTKVGEKSYQVTFVKEDTGKAKQERMRARIYTLQSNNTTLEDREVDLKSLTAARKKAILLPAQLWLFLKYPLGQDVTGYDYLRKISNLNYYYLKAARKDYKDKEEKAAIKKNISSTIKTLKNLDDLVGVGLAVYTGGLSVAGKEVASKVLGNIFIDPLFGAIGGIAADELLGKDIEKYPRLRQNAMFYFGWAENLFKGEVSFKVMLPPYKTGYVPQEMLFDLVKYTPEKMSEDWDGIFKLCEKFDSTKNSNTAAWIKSATSAALANMLDGFKYMEKVASTFEGKTGWWKYERDQRVKLSETKDGSETEDGSFDPTNNTIKLEVPKNTIALKVEQNAIEPILNRNRDIKNGLNLRENYPPDKKVSYFSEVASFDSDSDCYKSGITATDNSDKKESYASLVFNKPLPGPADCTITFRLGLFSEWGDSVKKAIKFYRPRNPAVYINYLLAKTKALEELEGPIKSFKAQIDNLGEENRMTLIEK